MHIDDSSRKKLQTAERNNCREYHIQVTNAVVDWCFLKWKLNYLSVLQMKTGNATEKWKINEQYLRNICKSWNSILKKHKINHPRKVSSDFRRCFCFCCSGATLFVLSEFSALSALPLFICWKPRNYEQYIISESNLYKQLHILDILSAKPQIWNVLNALLSWL